MTTLNEAMLADAMPELGEHFFMLVENPANGVVIRCFPSNSFIRTVIRDWIVSGGPEALRAAKPNIGGEEDVHWISIPRSLLKRYHVPLPGLGQAKIVVIHMQFLPLLKKHNERFEALTESTTEKGRLQCCKCDGACSANKTKRYRHMVNVIFDPEDERVVFMYTVGLHPAASELFALDVRKEDVDDVTLLMNYLSTRDVRANQTAMSDKETVYRIAAVAASREKELKRSHLKQMAAQARILELTPRAV